MKGEVGKGNPHPRNEDFWMEPRLFQAHRNCSLMPGSDPAGGSGGVAGWGGDCLITPLC